MLLSFFSSGSSIDSDRLRAGAHCNAADSSAGTEQCLFSLNSWNDLRVCLRYMWMSFVCLPSTLCTKYKIRAFLISCRWGHLNDNRLYFLMKGVTRFNWVAVALHMKALLKRIKITCHSCKVSVADNISSLVDVGNEWKAFCYFSTPKSQMSLCSEPRAYLR